MSSKSPAFQFYPHDFLGSGKVGTMTVDEVGAYTLLLCLEWNEGGFVYDEADLARFCRVSRAKFRKVWPRVSRCFVERDGRWYNPRLDTERQKQQAFRDKQKAKADARWSKPGEFHGNATALPRECSPSPSPTPVKPTTPPALTPEGGKGRKRGEPAPWMARFVPVWRSAYGGDMPKGSATALRPVVKELGEDEAIARFTVYCAETSGTYASVTRFAQTHGTYSTAGRQETKGKTALAELQRLGEQDPWWTDGLRAAS